MFSIFTSTLFLTFLIASLGSTALAAPTIKVVAPLSGSNVGSPIYFEAYAYSPSCKSGISAIRLYSAPNVAAATVYSNHIETFIALSPASYTTTLVAYDNCGGTSSTNIPVVVNSNSAVTTFLPSPNPPVTAGLPMHLVASAKSYTCANDIQSMRIYTSPAETPYTVLGNQIDAFVTLPPGTYNMVVQAWDNCGNVLKNSFTVTTTTVDDRFLYSTGGAPDNSDIVMFPLTKGTVGASAGEVAVTGAPDGLTGMFVDPAGYLLYATDGQSIYAYQIDRFDGSLQRAPGSPYKVGTGQLQMAMDPNGHFLFVSNGMASTLSSYPINRSDGSLGKAVTTTGIPGGNLLTNYTGSYLYDSALSSGSQQIYGFSVNTSTGSLSPLPFSPYAMPGTFFEVMPPATAWKYFYITTAQSCPGCNDQTYAYAIGADGRLDMITGSPFVSQNIAVLGTPVADWLTRYYWFPSQTLSSSEFFIETSDITGSDGALGTSAATSTGTDVYNLFAEDHSGQYLYGSGQTPTCNGQSCAAAFGSWTVSSSGQPVALSGPVLSGYNTPPGALANSR